LDADGRAILLALVLLLIALFLRPIPLKHDTYESLVIFDITQSMDVEDYEQGTTPISRLKFAREAARRALRELPCGSKVGWGAFAGYRTLILLAPVEVCENYGDLLTSLDKVDGGMRWENASEITKGVYWSMRAAKDLGTNPNVIFVTDGQEAPPLDPTNILPMFDDLKAGQVRGYLVGAMSRAPFPNRTRMAIASATGAQTKSCSRATSFRTRKCGVPNTCPHCGSRICRKWRTR
jgi:mxaL protein